jgi:hypothetical protein
MKCLIKHKITRPFLPILAALTVFFCIIGGVAPVYASTTCGGGTYVAEGKTYSNPTVDTSIDLGCQKRGNPITDMLFAVIRLLSAGVGIVVVASVIVAGIQFSTARSDPQAAGSAIGRIRASVIALLIYIFAYALLNFLIPGGFFNNSAPPSNNPPPSNNSSP